MTLRYNTSVEIVLRSLSYQRGYRDENSCSKSKNSSAMLLTPSQAGESASFANQAPDDVCDADTRAVFSVHLQVAATLWHYDGLQGLQHLSWK